MSRVLSVARIHTVAWALLIAWPLGILMVAFAIPWLIFALVGTDDTAVIGSVFSILGIALAFYITAMTQTFPFAVGLGVTRREFFAAILLTGAAQMIGFAIVLGALSVLEDVTGGWGVQMVMFGIPAIFADNVLVQFATFLAALALVAAVGLAIGAVQYRWRVTGLYTAALALLLVAGAGVIVVTWQRWWPAIGEWFADVPRLIPMVCFPTALAAILLVGAWATIRRATG